MNYPDNTLQAAIDATIIETKTEVCGQSFAACPETYPKVWPKESTARLALAKAFLAKLPEVQPILADDGRSLGQVAYEAWGNTSEDWHRSLTPNWQASAQAVANVVLAQAIRRMEAVTTHELARIFDGYVDTVRARLIAAARGEAEQQTEKAKPAPSTFEAHGKVWTRHTPGDPMPCDGDKKVFCISNDPRCRSGAMKANWWKWGVEEISIIGWRYADEPDSTDWKAKYEQAEAELAALKSSQLGIHFSDIRLPVTETPAQTDNEQPKQKVPLGPEDVMPGTAVRCDGNHWFIVMHVSRLGVCINSVGNGIDHSWTFLKERWQINRSIPLTGKWDENAWEPCYKLI